MFQQIARVVVSNDIKTPGTSQLIELGKEDGHADNDFSCVSKAKWAKYHQDRNVGQHRILQIVQFLNFLNFQNHREHVYNNFWKFHRNRMNGACSLGKVQHRVLQLVQFSNFLNFQNHPGNVYNNLLKFHRNRMNGVGSYTGHTHTDIDFYI